MRPHIWLTYHAQQSKHGTPAKGILISSFFFGIAVICLVSLSVFASDRAPIRVDVRPGNPSGAPYAEVQGAITDAEAGSRIVFSPGNHLVDNPVMLRKPGLQLAGAGRAETTISPRHAGRPVFVMAAPGIVIRDLTIDARVPKGSGRASFAIQIDAGVTGGEIAGNRILGTGASAVLGDSTNDLMVVDNEILDAGDDAIRLRGEDLNISRNFIFRYYDEAIDVIGVNVTISDNYVRMGRVGITLEVSGEGIISGNTVQDHYNGGIFLVSSGSGTVSENDVVDAGTVAYGLESPVSVTSNTAEGKNAVGFSIYGMTNGTVQQNVVKEAKVGWSLERSHDNLIAENRLCGGWEPWRRDEQSIKNRMQDNQFEVHCDSVSEGTGDVESRGAIPHPALQAQETLAIGNRYTESMDVTGVTGSDRKIADRIVSRMNRNNPGFMSLHIDGDSMRSLITPELSQTLSAAGQLAVGVVRVPFISFNKSRPLRLLEYPLWHLIEGDREVAVVAPVVSGVSARIFIMQDQGLGWKNSATLLMYRLQRVWHYGWQKVARRALLAIPALVILVAVVGTAGFLLRRKRLVRHH